MSSEKVEKKKSKQDYNITGVSGEFFVSAELSRRGLIATLTLKNTPLVDIVATNLRGKVANIQVKARSEGNKQGWVLNAKVDKKSNIQNHHYVFIYLYDKKYLPEYYIIPYNIFGNYIRKNHKRWLKETNKKGMKHNDSNVRCFKPEKQDKDFAKKYKNNWKILEIL